MSKLREMREQRSELVQANEDLVALAETEERDLTEDENSEIDSNFNKIKDLDGKIERQAKIEEMRKAKAVADHSAKAETPKEIKQFSFMEAIRSAASKQGPQGLYNEMHQEAQSEARSAGVNISLEGMGIPFSVLSEKRDQTAGTNNQGGFTVQTDIMGQSFIDALKNRIILGEAGANFMTGLQGDVAFPKFTELSFAWEGETDANAETTSTVSQVTMSPKRVGGFTDISKQLIIQSSLDIEAYIRGELVEGVRRAFDNAGINGTGASNQPTGILTLSTDINEIELGANGAALTWADVVNLESQVNNDNAPMGRSGYLTNSKVLGSLKSTSKDAGSGLFLYELDQMNGHPVYVSNAVPSNGTKGSGTNLSAIIYSSDWSELMMGMWGGIDLLVDPYTQGTSHILRLIVNMFGDVAVRNEQSFAFADDVVTS